MYLVSGMKLESKRDIPLIFVVISFILHMLFTSYIVRGVHACGLKPRTASLHVLFELDMIIKLEMQIKLLLALRRF